MFNFKNSHAKRFFKFIYFIFGCAGSLLLCGLFSPVVSEGYSRVVVFGLLTVAASPVAQRRPQGVWASVVAVPGL